MRRKGRPRSTGARRPAIRARAATTACTLANFADPDDTSLSAVSTASSFSTLPILRENWVISLRGRVQTTLDDDDKVPYFLLPQLGSGRTLRGY